MREFLEGAPRSEDETPRSREIHHLLLWPVAMAVLLLVWLVCGVVPDLWARLRLSFAPSGTGRECRPPELPAALDVAPLTRKARLDSELGYLRDWHWYLPEVLGWVADHWQAFRRNQAYLWRRNG